MQTIDSIQVLRAVAAIMVVVAHVFLQIWPPAALAEAELMDALGIAGVRLFFVISGFVMVYASERLFGSAGGALTFLTRRLIRIVPIYWAVTTLYVALACAIPSLGRTYSWDYIAASYLFFPQPRPNGLMQPVVAQGWTLNYEMMFYVLFAVAVLASRRIGVVACSVALVAMVVAGRLLAPLPPVLAFWTDPMVLDFVFGMLLGLAYREGVRLPRWVGLLLVASGLVTLLLARQLMDATGSSTLALGIPAAAVVAGAALGDFALRGRGWRLPLLIGDASYGLYLIHGLTVQGTFILYRASGLDGPAGLWLTSLTAIALSVAVAIATFTWFERPLTAALRRRALPVPSDRPGSPPDASDNLANPLAKTTR